MGREGGGGRGGREWGERGKRGGRGETKVVTMKVKLELLDLCCEVEGQTNCSLKVWGSEYLEHLQSQIKNEDIARV